MTLILNRTERGKQVSWHRIFRSTAIFLPVFDRWEAPKVYVCYMTAKTNVVYVYALSRAVNQVEYKKHAFFTSSSLFLILFDHSSALCAYFSEKKSNDMVGGFQLEAKKIYWKLLIVEVSKCNIQSCKL